MADCSLTLMPAEVVVRFGDKISVNCSTSSKEVSAMGWEATIGAAKHKNVSAITWTVEKVDVWTLSPMCYLNKRNGKQCFEVTKITVYSEYKHADSAIFCLHLQRITLQNI